MKTEIVNASREQFSAAWELLSKDLPVEDQRRQAEFFLEQERSGKFSASGLFVAVQNNQIIGAVWAILPSKVASIWMPRVMDDADEQTLQDLLNTAVAFARNHGALLAQAILDVNSSEEERRLLKAGFHPASELVYLLATEKDFPKTPPQMPWTWETYTPENRNRLIQLMEKTYQETLDCPELNGVLPGEEALDVYRNNGVFDPAKWLIARWGEKDVGCLFLTDHPVYEQWELVYMGLLPEARGKGWGKLFVRYAQWMCGQAGRERLVLAVDAKNYPALEVYVSTGFLFWEKRRVFLQVFPKGR